MPRRRSKGENRKVLLVDRDPVAREELRAACAGEFAAHLAASCEEALAAGRREGPFAVVVCGDVGEQDHAPAVLREIGLRWPETPRVLLAGALDARLAMRALEEGDVFRILEKPLDAEALCRVLRLGAERYRAVRTERFLCEQLQFTRETLLSFTGLLEERVEEQLDVLGRIHELAVRLNEANSLDEIARLVVNSASRALGDRGVRLVLSDGTSRRQVEVESGEWASSEAHEEPIATHEGELGVLSVDQLGPRGRRLVRVDRQVIASLASSTAVAAHNEIRRRERDEAQHATIFALARLAEHRDNETGRHLERVSEYCRLVAEGLRADGHYVDEITDHFVETLVRSAPLHDIGKVGIPDSILLKPGRLNEEEWVVMKTHTTIGAETLRAVVARSEHADGFLRMGLDIAWCHHEKWNGAGYPRGLAGADIPLSARILALADCYDALTTRRPYKQPWTHQEAIDLIRSRAGLDYDPRVVAAFLDRADRADGIRERLRDEPEDAQVEAA